MTNDERPFWFHAKWFGWGWGLPATWQGWLVLVIYFVSIFASIRFAPRETALPVVLLLTVLFIIVVAFKGERPVRWRWGRKD